jgi:hypothetical protein
MSIPERLYRLAKGKIGEIREMFDGQESDEIDPELLARVQRSQARKTARQELEDAVEGEPSVQPARAATSPRSSTPALRTPDEIRGAAIGTGGTARGSAAVQGVQDPLAVHYQLLGLEPGADYPTVQAVYEKLLSRCKPDRFPAGSPEAVEAHDIQNRLEATYKVLREALDPTARRFDMLEI